MLCAVLALPYTAADCVAVVRGGPDRALGPGGRGGMMEGMPGQAGMRGGRHAPPVDMEEQVGCMTVTHLYENSGEAPLATDVCFEA